MASALTHTILYLLQIYLLFRLVASMGQKECYITLNSTDAAATANRTAVRYNGPNTIISCTPCNYNGRYEVHILHVTEWTDPPLKVNVFALRDTVLYLLLVNVRPIHWLLHIPDSVTLKEARVLSYIDPQREGAYNRIILENGEGLNSFVARQHYSMFSDYPEFPYGEDVPKMTDYVNSQFGFITSYTGIRETSTWNLTVGKCDQTRGLETNEPQQPTSQPRTPIVGDERAWCNFTQPGNVTGTAANPDSLAVYQCTPCNTDGVHETYVFNIDRPAPEKYRQTHLAQDVVVEVFSDRKDSQINLVLINRAATNWIIRLRTYWFINVIEIHLLSANVSGSSVTLETAKYNPRIVERNMYIKGWNDIGNIEKYCYEHFGFLSSYNGIEETRKWVLNVGTCLGPYVESPEPEDEKRYSAGFPLVLLPSIIIPIIACIGFCFVPCIIERRLERSKKRREPPPVVTLNDLRRQLGTVRRAGEQNQGGEAREETSSLAPSGPILTQAEVEPRGPSAGRTPGNQHTTVEPYVIHEHLGEELTGGEQVTADEPPSYHTIRGANADTGTEPPSYDAAMLALASRNA